VIDEEVKMPEFPILPVMEHIRFMDPEEHDKLKVRRIKIKNKRKMRVYTPLHKRSCPLKSVKMLASPPQNWGTHPYLGRKIPPRH
jgi:hypothetical protein